jgi:hypothetical protein
MNVLTRDAKLKWLSTAAGLLVSCYLAVSLQAREVVTCESPDGKTSSPLMAGNGPTGVTC